MKRKCHILFCVSVIKEHRCKVECQNKAKGQTLLRVHAGYFQDLINWLFLYLLLRIHWMEDSTWTFTYSVLHPWRISGRLSTSECHTIHIWHLNLEALRTWSLTKITSVSPPLTVNLVHSLKCLNMDLTASVQTSSSKKCSRHVLPLCSYLKHGYKTMEENKENSPHPILVNKRITFMQVLNVLLSWPLHWWWLNWYMNSKEVKTS